jgi:hypothetical protein
MRQTQYSRMGNRLDTLLCLDRRAFLGALLGTGATLASPVFSPLTSLLPYGSSRLDEAEAQVFWSLFLEILGAAASIATILTFFNIKPTPVWAAEQRPNYGDAGGCTANFQSQEFAMSERGITSFAGVSRAPANRDVAIMIGRNTQSPDHNEAAMQYQGAQAINLMGRETEAVRAAAEYVYRNKRLPNNKLAQAIAITDKHPVDIEYPVRHGSVKVVSGRRFDTALGGYVLDSPWHPYSDGGAVEVYVPGLNEPDNPAVIGLSRPPLLRAGTRWDPSQIPPPPPPGWYRPGRPWSPQDLPRWR